MMVHEGDFMGFSSFFQFNPVDICPYKFADIESM